jgi:GH25 family lysozyme M1 (1,4-beta-N-acetylmuramidase)
MATLNGIDVSKHQGTIDWAKVSADFAMIRAGYGRYSTQIDGQLKANMAGCKSAGIPVGVYWYSYATTVADAKEEAKVCIAAIKAYKDQITLPVFFDQEYEKPIVALTNSLRTEICKAFCEAIKAAGYTPGIYASADWFANKLITKQLTAYPFWVAQYASKCSYTGSNLWAWQYSSTGKVSGISGNVDLDYGYFTLPTVAKWAKTAKGWTYGSAKSKWLKIDSRWYYFGSDGIAVTGWQKIDGTDYYFADKAFADASGGKVKECQALKSVDD